MAETRPPVPALLVVAAFSRHDPALAWARARLEEAYGPVALAGPAFAFDQTAYYRAAMGPDLRKQLLAFLCQAVHRMRTSTFLAHRFCRHHPAGHQYHKLLPYSSRRDAKSRLNLFDTERSLLL